MTDGGSEKSTCLVVLEYCSEKRGNLVSSLKSKISMPESWKERSHRRMTFFVVFGLPFLSWSFNFAAIDILPLRQSSTNVTGWFTCNTCSEGIVVGQISEKFSPLLFFPNGERLLVTLFLFSVFAILSVLISFLWWKSIAKKTVSNATKSDTASRAVVFIRKILPDNAVRTITFSQLYILTTFGMWIIPPIKYCSGKCHSSCSLFWTDIGVLKWVVIGILVISIMIIILTNNYYHLLFINSTMALMILLIGAIGIGFIAPFFYLIIGQGLMIGFIAELYNRDLVPEHLERKRSLKLHLSNWWQYTRVFTTLAIALIVGFLLTFVFNRTLAGWKVLIYLLAPFSGGLLAAICFTVLKSRAIERELESQCHTDSMFKE